MKKPVFYRVWSMILCVALLLGTFPVAAFATEAEAESTENAAEVRAAVTDRLNNLAQPQYDPEKIFNVYEETAESGSTSEHIKSLEGRYFMILSLSGGEYGILSVSDSGELCVTPTELVSRYVGATQVEGGLWPHTSLSPAVYSQSVELKLQSSETKRSLKNSSFIYSALYSLQFANGSYLSLGEEAVSLTEEPASIAVTGRIRDLQLTLANTLDLDHFFTYDEVEDSFSMRATAEYSNVKDAGTQVYLYRVYSAQADTNRLYDLLTQCRSLSVEGASPVAAELYYSALEESLSLYEELNGDTLTERYKEQTLLRKAQLDEQCDALEKAIARLSLTEAAIFSLPEAQAYTGVHVDMSQADLNAIAGRYYFVNRTEDADRLVNLSLGVSNNRAKTSPVVVEEDGAYISGAEPKAQIQLLRHVLDQNGAYDLRDWRGWSLRIGENALVLSEAYLAMGITQNAGYSGLSFSRNWNGLPYILTYDRATQEIYLQTTRDWSNDSIRMELYRPLWSTLPLRNALVEMSSYLSMAQAQVPELYGSFLDAMLEAMKAYETWNIPAQEQDQTLTDEAQRILDVYTSRVLSYKGLLEQSLTQVAASLLTAVPDNERKDTMIGYDNLSALDPARQNWDGTYYFVLDDGVTGRILAPGDASAYGTLATRGVTISGNCVMDADPLCAVTLQAHSTGTYALLAESGMYFNCEETGDALPFVLSSNYRGFDLPPVARTQGVCIGRQLTYNGVSGKHYLQLDPETNLVSYSLSANTIPAESVGRFSVYRRHWSVKALGEALKEYSSLIKDSNSYPQGLYEAFLSCYQEALCLYMEYNTMPTREQLPDSRDIQVQINALTEELAALAQSLNAAPAHMIATLPDAYNELMLRYTHRSNTRLEGNYYIAVREEVNSYHTMIPVNEGSNFGAVTLSMAGKNLIGADDHMAIAIMPYDDGNGYMHQYYLRAYTSDYVQPQMINTVPSLKIGVPSTSISTGRREDGMHFDTTIARNLNSVRYDLSYVEGEDGQGEFALAQHSLNPDNALYLFKLGPTLPLYTAIKDMAVYAHGNGNGQYPHKEYEAFLNCLYESVALYSQYNRELTPGEEGMESAIEQLMQEQAKKLLQYQATLTHVDTTTDYIDIPVEFLDFRGDSILMEFSSNNYSLSGDPGDLEPPGDVAIPSLNESAEPNLKDTIRQNLVLSKLSEQGHMLYTSETIEYVAKAILLDRRTDWSMESPGWNTVFYDRVQAINEAVAAGDTTVIGSLTKTFAKLGQLAGLDSKETDPIEELEKNNGLPMTWADVETAYDMSYYLLTYLWRPVEDDDGNNLETKGETTYRYNTQVKERSILRMHFNEERQMYLLDASYAVGYGDRYLSNIMPWRDNSVPLHSPFFSPVDGLGFESSSLIEAFGDTDRGRYYEETSYTYCEDSNFHYTMHAYGSFVYYAAQNQYFDFVGDDDVYFFIDGQKAMDIGGAHKAISAGTM